MAWFSLRVREVPGSTPGQARLWTLVDKTFWRLPYRQVNYLEKCRGFCPFYQSIQKLENWNQFPCIVFFFGELKDQLLSMKGGGKGQILRIIWFLEGGGGGISRLQQNFWGNFRSSTANGGGGGGGGRGHKNTTELTGGSGKFYYDKTKILRPLSP